MYVCMYGYSSDGSVEPTGPASGSDSGPAVFLPGMSAGMLDLNRTR